MKDYEIIIIGAGPAGLQAGIHAARRKHSVLILGKPEGSALYSAHIENYFGFKEKINGKDLLEAGIFQVQKFGGEILKEDAVRIEILEDNSFLVETEKGQKFRGEALILAIGVKRKKKLFKREDQFVGKGLSYCVDCDAWFYRGKRVAVLGDGSAAVHGAKTLTQFAEKVYFIPLKVIEELEEELSGYPVEIIYAKPVEILGEEEVKGVILEEEKILEVDGIFIEIGAKGALELIAPLGIELDPETLSYVKVDKKMQTNVKGIFACGDLTGPPLQLAKAVGEGCIAALSASDYLKSKKAKS
ncbi:MAG: NAD(P)/FAD-dependent oxidoreductase [Caldimicrobium sp.]